MKSSRKKVCVQPQSIEAERALLCSLFLDNSRMSEVIEVVDKEDFYDERNAILFGVMKDLYLENVPIDFITVKNALEEKGLLGNVGVAYLTGIVDFLPAPANAKYYAEIIKKKFMQRQIIRLSREIETICYEDPENIEEVINIAEERLFRIQNGNNNEITPTDLEKDDVKEEEIFVHGVKVQFPAIWGIVGATSAGKTEFVLDISHGFSTHGAVIFCEYEGTRRQMTIRAKRKGKWLGHDIVFLIKPSFVQIKKHIRKYLKQNKRVLVIIDYLQRFARYLQAQDKKATDNMRIYVNKIYDYFDDIRQESEEVSVLFLMSLSKDGITRVSSEKKKQQDTILNGIKESGDVQYDLDYIYAMLFSDSIFPVRNKEKEQLHLKRFKIEDKSVYEYMHLVPIKESRTGVVLTSNVYRFCREENWSGYALVSFQEQETYRKEEEDNLKDIPF